MFGLGATARQIDRRAKNIDRRADRIDRKLDALEEDLRHLSQEYAAEQRRANSILAVNAYLAGLINGGVPPDTAVKQCADYVENQYETHAALAAEGKREETARKRFTRERQMVATIDLDIERDPNPTELLTAVYDQVLERQSL